MRIPTNEVTIAVSIALLPIGAAIVERALLGLPTLPIAVQPTDRPPGFAAWVRLAHFANYLFLVLLARSGPRIPVDHPRPSRPPCPACGGSRDHAAEGPARSSVRSAMRVAGIADASRLRRAPSMPSMPSGRGQPGVRSLMFVETIVRWAMIASLAAAATLGVTLPLALRRGMIARARAWRVIRLVLGLLLTVAVAEVVFVIVVKGIVHRGDHQEWREDSPDP